MTKKGRHTGRPQVRGRPIGKWGGEVNGAAPRFPANPAPNAALPLLAIGPEGGWTDFELGLLEKVGFRRLTLGVRPLRTDVAICALAGALAGCSAGRA